MPDYHPDLDPFAHRDDEHPADGTPVVLHAGAYFVFHQRAGDDAHHFVLYSADGDALASGVASFDHTGGPRVLGLTVYAVQPAEGRAPAGPDAHPDLRVPAGRQPDGDDPPGRDDGLRAAGGEPGAGAPAVPGRGAVRDTEPERNWDAGIHTYRHSDRGIYDGEPDGPHPCPFCDRTDSHEHPIAVKLNPIGDA